MFGFRKTQKRSLVEANANPELVRQQEMSDAGRGNAAAVNSGVVPVLSPASNGRGMARIEERGRKVAQRVAITINTSAATAPVDVRLLGNINIAAAKGSPNIKTDEGVNYTRTSPNGAIVIDDLVVGTSFVTLAKVKIKPAPGVGDTTAGLAGRDYIQTGILQRIAVNERNNATTDDMELEQGIKEGNTNPNIFNTEFVLEPGMGRYDSTSVAILKAVPPKTILTVFLWLETVSGS